MSKERNKNSANKSININKKTTLTFNKILTFSII